MQTGPIGKPRERVVIGHRPDALLRLELFILHVPQPLYHIVESLCEDSELIFPLYRNLHGQIAFLDALGRHRHELYRARNAAGKQHDEATGQQYNDCGHTEGSRCHIRHKGHRRAALLHNKEVPGLRQTIKDNGPIYAEILLPIEILIFSRTAAACQRLLDQVFL